MLRIVNNVGKFMRQMTENQEQTLHQIGKFVVSKMDSYVAIDTGYLQSRNEYIINRNELFIQNDTPYAVKLICRPYW